MSALDELEGLCIESEAVKFSRDALPAILPSILQNTIPKNKTHTE